MVKGTGRKQPTDSARELESRLRETVQRYELVFKATNDVLYELDLQRGTVIWNEALYEQYGYSRDEQVGRLEWWTGHIHHDDALRLEDEIITWLKGGQDTWQAEYRFRKADGDYVYVRDRGALQRAPDGAPLRIIGSFLDITRQKQLERAKDEFISLVSHQMRTPLTAIRIYSEMLHDGMFGRLTSEQNSQVQCITDASVRLIGLVSDILRISRVELGHIVPDPTPTNVARYLRARIKEVLPLADAKGVAIQLSADTRARHVPIDTVIFDQIVHNLLTNAIRYTKPHRGIIQVAFGGSDDGYLLTVKDNGIGIPKSAQPHVFDRFYRANNAVNSKEQGTGLGLYLAKLMADAGGCAVWFESTPGKGTTLDLFPNPPHLIPHPAQSYRSR